MREIKTLHPDGKGRIALGILAKGVSSFHVSCDSAGRIILEPFVEIPAREQWLFQNKTALAGLKQGLQESHEGKISEREDFSLYLDAVTLCYR